MPSTYRSQNILHATSGKVEDDVVNTLWWKTDESAPTATIAAAINGHIAAAFATEHDAVYDLAPAELISAEISRVVKPTVKTYAASGGSPLAVSTYAGFAAPTISTGMPAEVACCLSLDGNTGFPEEAPDDADLDSAIERPASRRRGRIYFGPLSDLCRTSTAPYKPSAQLIEVLLAMGDFLANPTAPALTAVNLTLVVHSEESPSGPLDHTVTRVSVDDAFDTQRRRGRRSTARTFRSV